MAELVIGPLLRYVSRDAATIWVETDEPCEVEVCAVRQPTFTFAGHHYALVMLEGLEPGASFAYEVHLDGSRRWPVEGSPFPPSLIRTHGDAGPVTMMFGSCRSAAPHEPPYALRLDDDPRGKGVDALRAAGLRMLTQDPASWPRLVLFGGDQVYADDSSPRTAARIARTRGSGGPPPGIVADFEEYTWLYHEAWQPEIERWMLSTVPSAMMFDDHDMIDDWNISAAWVADIRAEPWWGEHVIGGLVSYWIHQHLGNLSPDRIRDEGLLDACVAAGDATELLREWALESESFTPIPGGYQFSYDRHLGDVHLVIVDCRNGRVLEPGARRMVDEEEWRWIVERTAEPADHVVLASSLPVFVPGGLHGIQQWSEAVCDGVWGRTAARLGERLRRAVDLEGWPAFDRSFRELEHLLVDVTNGERPDGAPVTVTLIGGDIHFAYVAPVELPEPCVSTVRQVVCSPIRNILRTRERRAMSFGVSRVGRRVGRWLMARAHRDASTLRWELSDGPVYDNNIGTIRFDGQQWDLTIEVATIADDGTHVLRPAITC